MAGRGPVPKRSSERRRRNHSGATEKVVKLGVVRPPAAGRGWHPIAKRWYASLRESGQSDFFEPSDWAAAHLVAETMTRHLASSSPSPVLFRGIWSAMTDLLSTEAARRRVRMEVERQPTADPKAAAGVAALDDYRRRLGTA